MFHNKRLHFAYWLTQSFYTLQLERAGRIRALFLGAHQSRNLANIKDPDIDDLRPKANLSVIDNKCESIPFPASNLPRLIAAISCLVTDKNVWEIAKSNATVLAKKESEERDTITYIERNFHEFNEEKVIEISRKNGTFLTSTIEDPVYNTSVIRWLQGSVIFYKRAREDGAHKSYIDQIITIGKDIKNNYIVIGFRKSWDNYGTIIPLLRNTVEQFLSAIAYLIYHPPWNYKTRTPIDFILPEYAETEVQRYLMQFRTPNLLALDFFGLPIADLQLKLE